MDLPTYTNIWRIEKRLYKLYDFRLPMPLPLGQIAVFTAIAVPYVVVLAVLGLPFSHTLLWLYVLPPGVLTWLATRPVLESKRLPELVSSQLRYLGEPRTWCRMAPHAEQDEVVVTARVWRRAARAELEDQIVPDTVAGCDDVAAGAAQDAVAEPDGLAGHAVRDGDANRERRADRRERRAGQEERELEVAAQSAVARAAHGVQPIGVTAQARTRAPAVPGPVVPGSAVRAPAMPGSAVPGPAVRAPSDAWSRCTGHCGARTGRGWVRRARARGAAAGPRGQPWPVAGAAISSAPSACDTAAGAATVSAATVSAATAGARRLAAGSVCQAARAGAGGGAAGAGYQAAGTTAVPRCRASRGASWPPVASRSAAGPAGGSACAAASPGGGSACAAAGRGGGSPCAAAGPGGGSACAAAGRGGGSPCAAAGPGGGSACAAAGARGQTTAAGARAGTRTATARH